MALTDTLSAAARRVRDTDWREAADDLTERTSRRARSLQSDTRSELARLREQVETLMRERVSPALDDASEALSSYGRDARDYASDSADRAVRVVKERPFLAIAVAAGAGILVAWLAASAARRD